MIRLRESELLGGMAHACELETSLMLKLAPDLVQTEKATRFIPKHDRFIFTDLVLGGRNSDGAIVFAGITGRGRYPPQGITGDPTVATKEKGEKWFDATVQTIVEFIKECKEVEIPPVRDFH